MLSSKTNRTTILRGYKMIVKMIGAAMMIDGIIEMALKSNDHRWTVDSMRLARIILGGVLFFM